jgi:DNA helicase-4
LQALQICHRDQLQTAINGYLAQLYQSILNGTAASGRDGKVSVFILGRYNADRHYVPPRWKSCYGDRMDIAFLTIHRSKGAEADYVILPGMVHKGFPNLRADDPVLALAMPSGDIYPLGEERRLFYVALTRARRSVVMFTVRGKSSTFLDELVNERAVTVTDAEGEPVDEQRCPACKQGVIVMREGRYGSFQSCSGFPKCRYKPTNQRLSLSAARRHN